MSLSMKPKHYCQKHLKQYKNKKNNNVKLDA